MIQEIADRHSRWMLGLLQGYHLSLSGAIALDDPARARTSIMLAAQSALVILEGAMQHALAEARQQALSDAGPDGWATAGAPELDEEATERLSALVKGDARTAQHQLHMIQLRMQLMLNSGMSPDAARLAARGELPGQRHDLFVQLDKAQRRFSSESLVVGTVRGLIFRAWGHDFAATLAARGIDRFVARRTGQEIELSFSGNWAKWAESELHPNCPWTLARKDAA